MSALHDNHEGSVSPPPRDERDIITESGETIRYVREDFHNDALSRCRRELTRREQTIEACNAATRSVFLRVTTANREDTVSVLRNDIIQILLKQAALEEKITTPAEAPYVAPTQSTTPLRWEKTNATQWTPVMQHPAFIVREVRGGRFIVMAYQSGRVRRGEHPVLVKFYKHFERVEDAQAMAQRLQDVLDGAATTFAPRRSLKKRRWYSRNTPTQGPSVHNEVL